MIFSESDSDTVTFNAHKLKYNEMASHDASASSSSSISFNTLEIDESTTSSVRSHPQKVEITIDSVAPYEADSVVVDSDDDNVEESEMNMNEHTNTSQDQRNQEKRTKNDEL